LAPHHAQSPPLAVLPPPSMAQIALPRHQATPSQSAGIGAPLYPSRQHTTAGPVDLLPNPDFSFPMRAPDAPLAEPHTTTRPLSLQAYPAGRRGSMPHQRQKSVSALPAFSFNPAGPPVPDTPPSPPRSVNMLPTTPTKPAHGHRRGGSEFIGGDVRPGGATLMSSSPTKADGFLCTPNSAFHPGPPAGRRGHAHRRSGAISSHDLTSIMSPAPPPSRTGSAPNTPAKGNPFVFGHSVNRSISQPSLRNSNAEDDADARPPSRARVGFADRVEYIRPLSTISSETETSLSTFRGHSATNSLSSMVGASSPQATRPTRPSLSTVEDEARPSTAGAVLDSFLSSPLSGAPVQKKRPMSAISPVTPTAPIPRVPTKRRGFFRLESRRCDNPVPTFPVSLSDPSLSKSLETSPVAPITDEESAEPMDKTKSVSRKVGKRPRKVKSWANSIIPRKSKKSKQAEAKASSPPLGSASDGEEDTDTSDDMDFVPNFDEDTTVTIVSPSAVTPPELKVDTSYASWQPRQLKRVDSDMMSPIIDLDAALGPFNTPNGSSPRTHQRGFSANRRVLHSASGLAPSHRRTESAPELVPFDFRPSTATTAAPMADVFEEEEPEDDLPMSRNSSKPSSIVEDTDEPKISLVEADDTHEGVGIDWNLRDGLCMEGSQTGSAGSSKSLPPRATSTDSSPGAELQLSPELTAVEVVEDFEEPRASLTQSSDSTITLQPSPDLSKTPSPINLPLPLAQQHIMTPDTVTSSFPSPDYSFDTPRIGTSTSSVTDYPIMPSPRFGEPGPELRNSVDDVPSLTSSRSTMTSAMQNTFPLASPRRFGDRTASLYSDPSEVEYRRGKRSSIASLSRLINSSSHSERSKLSIEQRPQSEHLEPLREKKKNNRLSKLKFWKSSKDS